MAVKFNKGIDLSGARAINAGDPSSATDLTTKQYVDNTVQGLANLKDPVKAATTGNITLTGTQTVDGVALVAGDRVLVKDQTDGTQNGIYTVAAGAWARVAEADTGAEIDGLSVTVLQGTTKGTGQTTANPVSYTLTNTAAVTIGSTALTFSAVGGSSVTYSGGAGLALAGTTFNVGAGNGITVNADDIQVDSNVVVRKYAADCVATTNPQTFTHGLGSNDVDVTVWEGNNKVFPDVTKGSGTVVVDWGSAPSAGQYRVVVKV